MENIGGFGTTVTILATKTFPVGFTLSKFSDDVAPIEFGESQVADHEFLVDGDIISFETATAVSVKVSVIPGTEDDENLNILLNSNKSIFRIGGFPDLMVMTINYPNQAPLVLNKGYIRSGPAGTSISEAGRGKGKQYEFIFAENTALSLKNLISTAAGAALSFL
jgi:hypothetical protein